MATMINMTYDFNPSPYRYMTTNNPVIRLQCYNQQAGLQYLDKSEDLKYIEEEPEIIELVFKIDSVVPSVPQTNVSQSQISHMASSIVSDMGLDDIDDDEPGLLKDLRKQEARIKKMEVRGRFLVTTLDDVYKNDEGTDESLPPELRLKDIDEKVYQYLDGWMDVRNNQLAFLNQELEQRSIVWNIVIPYYMDNNGELDPTMNMYYYEPNEEYVKFNFDFLVKNKSLFVVSQLESNASQNWDNPSYSMDIMEIMVNELKEIKVELMKDKANIGSRNDTLFKQQHIKIGKNLRITFFDIQKKPEAQHYGSWSCYDYEGSNAMSFLLASGCEFVPVENTLITKLTLYYKKNKIKEFLENGWGNIIPFSLNTIQTLGIPLDYDKLTEINRDVLKNTRIKHNMKGLTKLNIWQFMNGYNFIAVKKPDNINNNYSDTSYSYSQEELPFSAQECYGLASSTYATPIYHNDDQQWKGSQAFMPGHRLTSGSEYHSGSAFHPIQ